MNELLTDLAATATVVGVPVAFFGGFIALRSLRSQAKSLKLEAILTTNSQWQDLKKTTPIISLSSDLIQAVRGIYSSLGISAPQPAVGAPDVPRTFTAPVPFAAAALFPAHPGDAAGAPAGRRGYLVALRQRTHAFGYVRTALVNPNLSPQIAPSARLRIMEELAMLDEAFTRWVSEMNEIAELYDAKLIDRRMFISKRSVAIIQQMFAAEPYILWRNSTVPGRWGLRLLSLGAESRLYHWNSILQRGAIRLRVDPVGFEAAQSRAGFAASLGWIIGPGHQPTTRIGKSLAKRRLLRQLGAGFSERTKQLQNNLIQSFPFGPESGLVAPPIASSWLLISSQLFEVQGKGPSGV